MSSTSLSGVRCRLILRHLCTSLLPQSRESRNPCLINTGFHLHGNDISMFIYVQSLIFFLLCDLCACGKIFFVYPNRFFTFSKKLLPIGFTSSPLILANSSRSSLCLELSFAGVSTIIFTSSSPTLNP